GSAGGDSNVRFVELLDSVDEPFFGPSYRVRSYEPNGDLFDSQSLMDPFSSRDNTKPYLISTSAADSHFGVTGDKTLSLGLPPGNAGQVCFENESSSVVIECLSYGTITSPVTAESGNEHGPAL